MVARREVHELRIVNHIVMPAFVIARVHGLGVEAGVVVGAKERWLASFT